MHGLWTGNVHVTKRDGNSAVIRYVRGTVWRMAVHSDSGDRDHKRCREGKSWGANFIAGFTWATVGALRG